MLNPDNTFLSSFLAGSVAHRFSECGRYVGVINYDHDATSPITDAMVEAHFITVSTMGQRENIQTVQGFDFDSYEYDELSEPDKIAQIVEDLDIAFMIPFYIRNYGGFEIVAHGYENEKPDGYAFYTDKDMDKMGNGTATEVQEWLTGEVSTYSTWLDGDIYSFTIYDESGDIVASLSGLYGPGDEYAIEELENELKAMAAVSHHWSLS